MWRTYFFRMAGFHNVYFCDDCLAIWYNLLRPSLLYQRSVKRSHVIHHRTNPQTHNVEFGPGELSCANGRFRNIMVNGSIFFRRRQTNQSFSLASQHRPPCKRTACLLVLRVSCGQHASQTSSFIFMFVDLCKQEVYHLYSFEVLGHSFSICIGNFLTSTCSCCEWSVMYLW